MLHPKKKQNKKNRTLFYLFYFFLGKLCFIITSILHQHSQFSGIGFVSIKPTKHDVLRLPCGYYYIDHTFCFHILSNNSNHKRP